MKYIATIRGADTHQRLKQMFEKVGEPRADFNTVIVTTARPIEDVQAVEGVIKVIPDGMFDMEDIGWALPWISNTGGTYESENDGSGVDIYVLDTGVRDTHKDLAGKVTTIYSHDGLPYSEVGGSSPTHGTCVAGCAAGTQYGVAKGARIINCRFDFSFAEGYKALDTILYHHLNKDPRRQSILNFSGSTTLADFGLAFERLAKYGIVVVAAAGNYNEPMPRYPARNPWVVAVGALDEQGGRSSFSNMGANIYAPGTNVKTAHVFSDISSVEISGTSFSSPYTAAGMALALQGSDRFNTGEQVGAFTWKYLKEVADQERIPWFPNSGIPPVTLNTSSPWSPYYKNESLSFSDEEINLFCLAHVDNPQHIADMARQYNVDLNRLVAATGYSAEEINTYFKNAGVSPWWPI